LSRNIDRAPERAEVHCRMSGTLETGDLVKILRRLGSRLLRRPDEKAPVILVGR
jgi:hypothetical protein